MAVIRDVMPAFELFQPSSIADAQRLLEQYREDAWVMAGGLDSFDWLKDRIKRPKVVVDLSGIAELKGVRTTSDGIEIGAMTTLSEVVKHPVIREKYGLLAEGAELAASPQIRNQGTIGGNVSQDTRCWYYRAGWPCYRAGGNICYADTPTGRNREHAILHAERCVAVNPSDSAPALIALDAKFVLRTPNGERIVDAEDYFIGPDIDITRLHILKPGDLLTAIRIPSTWAGARFYFEKVRDRNVWDFALMNVASAMQVSGNTVERMRLAVNGAAARPLRLKAVEDAVRGKPATAATGEMAGRLAVRGAVPLQFNAYKIPLMRNCQCRSKTPAVLPVLTNGSSGLRRTAGSSFLLTSSENCPTIEDGRRSGGDCWRAPPRNTRLDSSRTMGGAQATAPDLKHIGPIDPDAFTLNQFLNRAVRATADVLVDGGEVQVKILAHCGTQCAGRATSAR